MIRQLQAPPCHWAKCSWFGKPMKLLNEGDSFWMFACECGCTRAVSKPSTREAAMYAKYAQDIELVKRYQRERDSRPDFSFPSRTK